MTDKKVLKIKFPAWAKPLGPPRRYKGAKGGRASGKSHYFAEALVFEHIRYPWLQTACIREVQKSLKYSAKKLIEQKIAKFGAQDLFDIKDKWIKRKGGEGLIIFEGMQDHTADSIKSLEGFHRAWIEEAQNLSARSMELLLPTIRQAGSELWFSWNPENEKDPVERLFKEADPADAVLIHVNYLDNKLCPDEMLKLAEWQKRVDYEKYVHIWLGGYNTKSASQVLAGKWRVDEFEPGEDWHGPYFGADWGFSTDPTALVKFWLYNRTLYVEHEVGGAGVEIADTPALFDQIDGAREHVVRADNARPEIISHMVKHGYERVVAAHKWPGSIEDGVSWLRGLQEIVIHPRCKETAEEARLWSYKVDKLSGDVLPALVDKHNHYWDAIRYGAEPMIKQARGSVFLDKPDSVAPVSRYALLNGQWVADQSGELSVWGEPTESYVVGAVYRHSTAGVSCIQVVDQTTGRQAAHWEAETIELPQFTEIVRSLCHRYATAWAVVDVSMQGVLVVDALRKLHRRVYSEIPPEAKTGSAPRKRRFGFDGTKHMPVLVEKLALDCTNGLSGLTDGNTIGEMDHFTRDHDNAIAVIPGLSHERVLAYCLARHGIATLPKPAAKLATTAIGQQAGGGWAGHV